MYVRTCRCPPARPNTAPLLRNVGQRASVCLLWARRPEARGFSARPNGRRGQLLRLYFVPPVSPPLASFVPL